MSDIKAENSENPGETEPDRSCESEIIPETPVLKNDDTETVPEKKKNRLVLIICFIVIAAGLIAGGILLSDMNTGKGNSESTKSEVTSAGGTEEVKDAANPDITGAAAETETSSVTELTEEAMTEQITETEAEPEINIPVSAERGYGIVITETDPLNIRKGPGTDYEISGTVDKGKLVYVTGKEGDWYKISSGTDEKYVSAEFIDMSSKSWQEKYADFIEAYIRSNPSDLEYLTFGLADMNKEDNIPELIVNTNDEFDIVVSWSAGSLLDLARESHAQGNALAYYDGNDTVIFNVKHYVGRFYSVIDYNGSDCSLRYEFNVFSSFGEASCSINDTKVSEDVFNSEVEKYDDLVSEHVVSQIQRYSYDEIISKLRS